MKTDPAVSSGLLGIKRPLAMTVALVLSFLFLTIGFAGINPGAQENDIFVSEVATSGTGFGITGEPPGVSDELAAGRTFQPNFPGDIELMPLLLRFLLGFIVVLGAVMGVRVFIEKRAGSRSFKYGRVIEMVPLQQGAALYIVETAGKFLVVGVTPGSVTHIADIVDPKAVEILRFSDPAKGVQFSDMIADLIVQGRERLDTTTPKAKNTDEGTEIFIAPQEHLNI